MGNVFDRLAQGPQGQQSQQYSNWNEMVGAAPPAQFSQATADALRQANPQDYYRHTQPGVDNTDPFGALPSQNRSGLAQSLLGALFGAGASQNEVSRALNGATPDPNTMTPAQMAQLAQYMQQNHPDALAQVAAQNQDNPSLLESLLGNKLLLATAAILGAKYLNSKLNNSGSHQK